MKRLPIALLGLCSLLLPALAIAATPSPLVGRWALNVSTLPMPPEMRPKQVELEFRDTADGKWNSRVKIVDQADKVLESESALTLDGAPGSAIGSYWVDVINAKMPEPNVLVMQFVYQGVPRSTRIYTVNADGSVLTETETYFKDDATPMMRTAHFHRVTTGPNQP